MYATILRGVTQAYGVRSVEALASLPFFDLMNDQTSSGGLDGDVPPLVGGEL